MSDTNKRLKELRIHLGMNQRDFAESIHISQSSLAQLENEIREPRDILITQICAAFHVSERWLRTGEGDMFAAADEGLLTELAAKYDLDDKEVALIRAYLTLEQPYRDGVLHYAEKLVDELNRS